MQIIFLKKRIFLFAVDTGGVAKLHTQLKKELTVCEIPFCKPEILFWANQDVCYTCDTRNIFIPAKLKKCKKLKLIVDFITVL